MVMFGPDYPRRAAYYRFSPPMRLLARAIADVIARRFREGELTEFDYILIFMCPEYPALCIQLELVQAYPQNTAYMVRVTAEGMTDWQYRHCMFWLRPFLRRMRPQVGDVICRQDTIVFTRAERLERAIELHLHP